MRITIIGLGLIGGSAALAWKQAHAEGRFPGGSLSITAVDTNPATLSLALERGIADRVTPSIAEGVLDADLVLLAVPVLAMGAVMKEVDRAAPVDAVITDAGSVRGRAPERASRAHPSLRAPSSDCGRRKGGARVCYADPLQGCDRRRDAAARIRS